MKTSRKASRREAFTLMELMLVILIIVILSGIALPAYNGIVRLANETHSVKGLQSICAATVKWAGDHSNRLPSPIYPGGHVGELPKYADLGVGGEPGLWLNGVVYAAIYVEPQAQMLEDQGETDPQIEVGADSKLATDGDHLVSTVFESKSSIKANPSETDWYRHSYAMNANLQYDEINKLNGSSDPWFTEKEITKFIQPRAMLFVDCVSDNIVFAEDVGLIEEAAEERHGGRHVIIGFMDGHVEKISPHRIPDGDVNSDRDTSQFWRGVLPD